MTNCSTVEYGCIKINVTYLKLLIKDKNHFNNLNSNQIFSQYQILILHKSFLTNLILNIRFKFK